ncbi:MAG: thiamine pyrophosphate-dependent enzyme [Haloechinothrix sp.]
MSSPTAAEVIVQTLAEAGVRRFYTVPGESFLEIIEAVTAHPRLRLISTRHESGAGFMAEADAKLIGVPTVAMATRAVGAANLAIAVHTARQDSTPMVVLLGQVETGFLGREAFQEVDLPAFYREITTWSATLYRPDRAREYAMEAVRRATYGRPGPTMLALPADLLGQPEGSSTMRPLAPPPAPAAAAHDVRALAQELAAAERPVLIVGGGSLRSRANVVDLAERTGAGVYSAFRRQDAFPNDHSHYLGHLTLGTPQSLLQPLSAADVVVAIGCRLSEVTTQGYSLPRQDQRLYVCDTDPDTVGAHRPVTRAIIADAAHLVDALLEAVPQRKRDWSAAHSEYLRVSEPRPEPSGGGVHPDAVLAAMRRLLPSDAILTNDAGNFSTFCHSRWRFEVPGTQLGPTSGAMGYAVPAAVGAALAAPGRRVVALAGDGGFLMTGQELETACREGARILVIVFQNMLYGTIALHQARSIGRQAGVDIGPVDIAGFSRSLGAQAETITDAAQLEDGLSLSLMADGPFVLAIRTDPDVLTPTTRLSHMRPAEVTA